MGKNVIMIMVDGFGIPAGGWHDSVYSQFCGREFTDMLSEFSIPIDASLGVDGIPQSATGQTSLFTGINAAKIFGRHMQGFPLKPLREIIRGQNIFKSLINKGKSVAFANAYVKYSLAELAKMNLRSVTTVMLEASLGWARGIEHLLSGTALYHDITNENIIESAQNITPRLASANLLNISENYDFTLFEYFLTDMAGHKREPEMLRKALGNLAEFLCPLVKDAAGKDRIIILTGDHGNCEDLGTKSHTLNPVPLFMHGFPHSDDVRSIHDVFGLVTEKIFRDRLDYGFSEK